MSQTCKLDATRIAPKLYQGSAPPVGRSVRACGFDVLVLAAQEYQPPAAFFPGVEVVHAPLDDSGQPMTSMERGVAGAATRIVVAALRAGARVLVTCAQGRNRSGLLTALALRKLTRESAQLIVVHIQSCRHGALTNEEFVRVVLAA